MPMIRLYVDSKKPGVCRAETCRAPLAWYETLAGHAMPMNAGARPTTVEGNVGIFDAGDSHWATCPARARFGQRRQSGGRRDEPARGRDDLDGRRQQLRRKGR